MIPEIGRRFGPYEIQSRLGGGGMGQVFKAWDARLHREVALKLLRSEYATAGMRERFLGEARTASALNHPHICTIFDIGEQDGELYLVMELLQGETLKDRILERPIKIEDLICIAKEIAEGLGAAHAKGVIHRDIKPANIFLVDKPNGSVQTKVLDFGLAKVEGGVLGSRARSHRTAAGVAIGTLAYMSPEQARGEELDMRTDLFSLGVVMYEMATRQIPFPGATSALVFVKLLNHAPEAVREWNETVPKEVEKIILKLMAKERTARFQTARELEEALAQAETKLAGGGWMRRAAANVPLVKAVDPIARERRKSKRSETAALRESPPVTPQRRASDARGSDSTGQAGSPRKGSRYQPPSDSALPRRDNPIAQGTEGPRRVEPAQQNLVPAEGFDAPATGDTPPALLAGPASQASRQDDESSYRESEEGSRSSRAPKTKLAGQTLGGRGWLVVLAVAVAAVAITAPVLYHHGRFGFALLTDHDAVTVTEVENRTGEKAFDGIVSEGLRIALMQSPYLVLRSGEAYRSVRRQMSPAAAGNPGSTVARAVAQRMKTRAYFFGSIETATGRGAKTSRYLLHIDMRDTGSDEVMAAAETPLASVQELPDAIDRVAQTLRRKAGEDGRSIAQASNPLRREATSNMDALRLYRNAEDALSRGSALEALSLDQRAAGLDNEFVQPELRLTYLYRKLRAELAAGDAARVALAASAHTSDLLRAFAQFEFEMNATGDFDRAAVLMRQVLVLHPHDAGAAEGLARALRLQGRMAEALDAARQAYAENPLDEDAYTQAEDALIGLDRYDATFQLEGQVQRLGLSHPGGALIPAYLEGKQEIVDAAAKAFDVLDAGYRPDWAYGIYLDNGGRLAEGAALWQSRANAARQVEGLASAASYLLSQSALDHALAGDCVAALAEAGRLDRATEGLTALFNTGMSYGLCGDQPRTQQTLDELARGWPRSFAVQGYYLANIRAALALSVGNPAAALDDLTPARQFDLISYTPFLRGRAHVALHEVQIGIVDFQTILSHRGVTFLVGSDVYPVAQIGVARAFAEIGDMGNSVTAYRVFLNLWRGADHNQPLWIEASAHAL